MESKPVLARIQFIENEPEKDTKRKKGIKRTFPIEDGILETLERAAYWDRTDKNKIIETALESFFKGKSYEEIPKK